ncbi:glycosyltransferase [Cyclobacterium salsum]|uniref:glycosyltransferase n=1 Tax=Cyclobacterium salsum TaxID=2666329 RepID=UPI001F21C57F|nr:glycosyltransferase [Cyclobacterium salsum]
MSNFSINEFKQLPIVMTSMSRWDGDFSSASWSLAKTFAQNQVVIYVDYPFTLIDFIRERKKTHLKARIPALLYGKNCLTPLTEYHTNLFALTPPLMLPINWLPPGKLYRLLAGWNNRRLSKSIQKGLLKLTITDFIFFNSFNPLYLSSLPKRFTPKAFVYQSRDNIRALEPYLRKHGSYLEIEAVKNARLSLATSRLLQKDLEQLSGENVAYFPNAADFNLFKSAFENKIPLPDELKNLPRPIIGYTGNICHRIDYELLKGICENNPEKSMVLVGPRNHWGHTNVDLDKLPNLHFTGPKKIEQLPSYLAHFDVLILPFLCNEVTRSIYPLKINEYLASGKPIVATPFSEDIQSFSPLIRLEKDALSFSRTITEELESDTPQKGLQRYQEASKNTWEGRVSLFWELLNQTFSL